MLEVVSYVLFTLIGVGGSALLVYLYFRSRIPKRDTTKKEEKAEDKGAEQKDTKSKLQEPKPVAKKSDSEKDGTSVITGLLSGILFVGIVIVLMAGPHFLANSHAVTYGNSAIALMLLWLVLMVASEKSKNKTLGAIAFWACCGALVSYLTPWWIHETLSGYPLRPWDATKTVVISHKPVGPSIIPKEAFQWDVKVEKVVNPSLAPFEVSPGVKYMLCNIGDNECMAKIDAPSTATGYATYLPINITVSNRVGSTVPRTLLLSGGHCVVRVSRTDTLLKECGTRHKGGGADIIAHWVIKTFDGQIVQGLWTINLAEDDGEIVLYTGVDQGLSERNKWLVISLRKADDFRTKLN